MDKRRGPKQPGKPAALEAVDVRADGVQIAGRHALFDLHHVGKACNLVDCDIVRRIGHERAAAASCDGKDQIAAGDIPRQRFDFLAALNAGLVRHGMARQRDADLFADDGLAVLGNDMATGQHIAQRFLHRQRRALHALGRADDIHAVIVLQIKFQRPRVRVALHLEAVRMQNDLPILHMDKLLHPHIRVERVQSRVQQLRDDFSPLAVAVRGQLFFVGYPHIRNGSRRAREPRRRRP